MCLKLPLFETRVFVTVFAHRRTRKIQDRERLASDKKSRPPSPPPLANKRRLSAWGKSLKHEEKKRSHSSLFFWGGKGGGHESLPKNIYRRRATPLGRQWLSQSWWPHPFFRVKRYIPHHHPPPFSRGKKTALPFLNLSLVHSPSQE